MTRDRRAIPATCACLLIVSLMSVPSVRAVGEGDTPGNDRNHAASAPDPMELEFFSLVNQSRAAAQLPLLRADDTLSAFTRSHTRDMVERRGLFHSAEEARMAVAAAGWQRLGENVGVGSSPETLHDAFMGSSHHRDNILGDYDGIAIGADRGDDGRLYVTVVFVKRSATDPERRAERGGAGRNDPALVVASFPAASAASAELPPVGSR